MAGFSAFAAVGLAIGVSSSAFAGFIATDPAAMPAWRGTQNFNNGVINANVDYAVYAPGAYGAADPSGGTRFVYVYQLFNISATRAVSNLTVGIEDAALSAFDGGFDATRPTFGGVIPLFQDSLAGTAFPSSSFRSIFQTVGGPFTKVNPGQHSQVLLFTSPFAPQLYASSVIDEGEQSQRLLPSPAIPGPTAVAVLAVAGVTSLRRRRSVI
jgi:MYXO-CTERM domain-containing protein